MTLTIQLVEAPKDSFVTTDDAIQYFRIPDLVAPEERNLIDLCLKCAFEIAELSTNLAIRPATYRLYLDSFPCRTIELPNPPLKSFTKIHYSKEDGTEADVSADVYQVDAIRVPARVGLKAYQSWPTDSKSGLMNAIYLEYVAGYASAELIPDTLRLACLNLAQHFYDTRNPVVVGAGGLQAVEVPKTFDWAFKMHRVLDFHNYVTGQ